MLPYIPDIITKKAKQICVFQGINQNKVTNDNELVKSVNMCSKDYPVLSVAKSFENYITTDNNINGALSYNGLFYTAFCESENKLYAHHKDNNVLISENATDGKRFFAGMSDNILIMPDKILYQVSSKTAKPLTHTQSFDIDCAIDRANTEMPGISSTVPKGVAVITSSYIDSNLLTYGVYSSYMFCPENIKENEFVFVKMKITTTDTQKDKQYADLISTLEKGIFIKVTRLASYEHYTLNGNITQVSTIHFEGAVNIDDNDKMYVTDITIEKRIPDFSHICTYGNRMWGVENNSIRCSLLGDCTVWEDFSADAFGTLPSSCFSLEVDSGGEFTAICEYNGNIVAFKENCIHKIYGNQPENYTLHTQSVKGVEKGAHNTLININGILYYKGIDGFYKYSGGVPVCISQKIDNSYKAICSATDGNNYYTIVERDGKKEILTYDTTHEIWHTMSAEDAHMLLYFENSIALINKHSIKKLGLQAKDNTKWKFEFEFDENTFCKKRYMRLLFDYALRKNGYFKITAIYDDNHVLNFTSGDYIVSPNGESIINLPFVKCKKINIIFEGSGDFTLKKLTREYILLKEGGK